MEQVRFVEQEDEGRVGEEPVSADRLPQFKGIRLHNNLQVSKASCMGRKNLTSLLTLVSSSRRSLKPLMGARKITAFTFGRSQKPRGQDVRAELTIVKVRRPRDPLTASPADVVENPFGALISR